jgi:sulfite reductase alpha subunit-like flavoprotein
MKYNIVKNESRKTLSVILTPITINYAEYLYKKYQDKKYFASGVVRGADYTKDLLPFAKELAARLNELGKDILPNGITITTQDIITMNDDEYKLFTRNLNKEGDWDKQFKVNLTNRSKDAEKKFLFLDLEGQKPITKDDSWKHIYAIELEIGVGYDEDKQNKYVYAIFHRGVSTGLKETNTFQKNDNAWSGFKLETKQEVVAEDDDAKLPF